MVGPLALAGVLNRLVMADDAARACSEQPVVTSKVPGNTADSGALQASPSRRGSRTQREAGNRHRQSRREQYRFHIKLLQSVVVGSQQTTAAAGSRTERNYAKATRSSQSVN